MFIIFALKINAERMIKVEILDDDLRELILYGVNAGKYKRIARDKRFVKKLTDIYNLMKSVEHVSKLRITVSFTTSN